MELITSGYTKLALIECSCCREDHTLAIIEDDGELYFDFKEIQSKSFFDAIKHKIDFLINWKEYVDGNKMTDNGILVKYDQVKLLYELLTRTFPDMPMHKDAADNRLIPITYKNQKTSNEYTKILFDNGEIIFSEDIQINDSNDYTLAVDWFTLGYHLPNDSAFKNAIDYIKNNYFYNGEYCGCIEKEQVTDFISALSIAMEEHKIHGGKMNGSPETEGQL